MATLKITSDSDPYPVLAGNNLKNDGTPRTFSDSSNISDQSTIYTLRYRAGSNTLNPQVVAKNEAIGITNTGVLIYSPESSLGVLPISLVGAPPSFSWNIGQPSIMQSEFSYDPCGGKPENGGEYRYRSCTFYRKGMVDSPEFKTSSTYYTSNIFGGAGGDELRHTDGHSKIIGWAFDGFPIYGPYGYNSALDTASGNKPMRSSYQKKNTEPLGRNFSFSQRPRGDFIQDFEYSPGSGDLDEYNGRYCKTPDYATGTYAYFLTFEDTDFNVPEYPYIIGPSTREQRSATKG